MTEARLSYYEELIRALEIFRTYGGDEFMSASHDIVYAGPEPKRVSAEHLVELEELGWHPDGDTESSFYHFV